MLTAAIAKHLDILDIVTYQADGTIGGDCFIDHMPASPDTALVVTLYGGLPQRSLVAFDLPTVQLRARGPKHRPDVPLALLEQAYSALHGLGGVLLDEDGTDEVWVVGCTAQLSASSYIGMDDNDRHERTQNYDLHVHAPTTHRPAISA